MTGTTPAAGLAALHSRYNPQGEAEKYIAALNLREGIECFILIEPGLGYLIPALENRFPRAKILALHAEAQETGEQKSPADRTLHWSPGSGPGLEQFLEQAIPDMEAARIRIIEWRPSLDYYGEAYLTLLSAAAAFIKQADANSRTVKNFGRRWFRNVLKNLRLLGNFPHWERLNLPVIITGAGPGLEETLPLIAQMRREGTVFILAASSSVQALLSRGIVPDLALGTDGGGWALLHLYECFRNRRTGTPGLPVIAAGLCAALP
jgi:hypothetical protein